MGPVTLLGMDCAQSDPAGFTARGLSLDVPNPRDRRTSLVLPVRAHHRRHERRKTLTARATTSDMGLAVPLTAQRDREVQKIRDFTTEILPHPAPRPHPAGRHATETGE